MTSRALKWIAIITMTLDHLGLYLITDGLPILDALGYPNVSAASRETWFLTLTILLRGLGRMAFPLFAFFIAEGMRHTRSRKRYAMRIFAFALFVEVCFLVYYFISGISFNIHQNVFWVLLFGMAAITLLESPKRWMAIFGFLLIPLGDIIGFSYGGYGIAWVMIFYFVTDKKQILLYSFIVNLFYISYPLALVTEYASKYDGPLAAIQWFSMLSLIPIFFYNGKKGTMKSWFFYLYYPLHLAVILGIAFLLGVM